MLHPLDSLTDPLRLAALERTGLLDSPTEAAYDRMVRLAARLLRVPTAMVNLVDGARVFVKSGYGLDASLAERRTLELSQSFCPDVVAMRAPVTVQDARVLLPARGGPAAPSGVVAYAGMPLTTRDGAVIGSLCVIDDVPRAWTEEELEALADLAATVTTEIELRVDARERERVERTLDAERVFFNAVLEHLEEGIAACDARGVMTFFNRAAREMHGLDAGEVPAGRWAEHYALYRPDGTTPLPAEEVPLWRALMGERVREHALEIAPADGVRRRVMASGQVLRDGAGRSLGAMVAMRDVTVQTRAEQELRASEERYRSLVEAASDIIYQTDVRGCFTYINPVACKVMEFPAEMLLGMHFTSLVREDAREAALEFYLRQMEERIPTTYYEFPTITGGGREVWIGQNVQLIHEGERIRGCQAVARDITAQHEMERIKDEFLAVVSHELRTPLTALRGALGLLASGRLGEIQPQGQRMLGIAADNADRLARLVNDILDLERIERGKLHLERRVAEVATLMEDAVLTLRDEAERAGVHLLTSPVHSRLRGDPDRVLQALTNLLSNAIKFSPQGGSVWLTAAVADGAVEFRVSDEGRGIPADKLEIIFDRFQQVDSSDARQKGGTGLGLAITRGIVEQHGGRIWVESEWGRGSTFHFTVPLEVDEAPLPV